MAPLALVGSLVLIIPAVYCEFCTNQTITQEVCLDGCCKGLLAVQQSLAIRLVRGEEVCFCYQPLDTEELKACHLKRRSSDSLADLLVCEEPCGASCFKGYF